MIRSFAASVLALLVIGGVAVPVYAGPISVRCLAGSIHRSLKE
jgi:hypothetical protein